jgi:hypothetical protein
MVEILASIYYTNQREVYNESYYSGMFLEAPQVVAQASFSVLLPYMGWLNIEKNRNFGIYCHRWWFFLK